MNELYYVCQRCHTHAPTPRGWSALIIGKFTCMICPECAQLPENQLLDDLNLTEHVAIIEGLTK